MIQTNSKEMIAMLLAGGQGSRLGVLTNNVAKPAVPFGGKYRIIDFPLSNCVNSGIDTIGVLTQYQPLELNAYIGNGQPWDLDRLYGGVSILPPYVKGSEGEWYKGTANAIYQNIHFIEMYRPKYVLILSGDHIYKMNYDLMLKHHKEKNADCTIAVLKVPIEEASRFGVMNADDNLKIYEFEEKPKEPKSNLVSMGVYIFTWDKLKEFLIKDEGNKNSDNDFGKNIIPAMLEEGQNLYAYEYNGYWKDVGTVESLWEANMDLLNPNVPIELNDPPWKIYSRNGILPPQCIGENAKLHNSSISEGCKIDGEVENSIIFPGVIIEKDVIVSNSIIMPSTIIESGSLIEYSIIASNVVIEKNSQIGLNKKPILNNEKREITVIGQELIITEGTIVPAGVMVDKSILEKGA
ncbi:glucose-1-phosphate adenylyltransferase [Anaerovorax odorimutans]|uniref:glucose-1-phosphate adenylyltransferase n=1 Tax=Anaerovorax odorimutans TaxID=109327 RepID=UPI00040E1F12|nr:glucose-1-phosphate adenylyltransferase [Anaerovorax odorimutans]